MNIVVSSAGLANRMFQYALYLSMKEKNINVAFDEDSYSPLLPHEHIRLEDIFCNIKLEKCNHRYKYAGIRNFYGKCIRKILSILNIDYYIYWGFKYNPKVFSLAKKNRCFIGTWQSELYFFDIKSRIKDIYTFPPLVSEKNIHLYSVMQNCQSVAIHVRKGGDYSKLKIFKDTCSVEYYRKAYAYIIENVKSPIFFVFTDNTEWVRKEFVWFDYTLVDWNPGIGKDNYVDMQLMSYAQHNIIANSTYSWWGAWLNNNPNKIVIAPKLWFNPINKLYRNVEIVPTSWVEM